MAKQTRHKQGVRNRQRRVWSSERTTEDDALSNPLDEIVFTLDGQEFGCDGKITFLDASQLAAMAMSGTDIRSPAGIAMVHQFLSMALGPVNYMRLAAHVREHDTPPRVLFGMVTEITDALELFTEEQTGRPTMPPSSSHAGPPGRDEQISRIISLGTGDVTVVDPEATGGAETATG